MDENFEYKLDQLKMGIGELLTRVSTNNEDPQELREQIARMILDDIKRVMEEKHNFIQEQLYSFENMVKSVLQNTDSQKLFVETNRISADLNTVYTKLGAQEMLLQNMYRLIDTLRNDKTADLVENLNSEFINFSRGFENITAALNRNFTEFLAQIQAHNAKDDIKKLSLDLDGINSNTNAIISALAIIDHKYQDLKNLMALIVDKENNFIEGLKQLGYIREQFEDFSKSLQMLLEKDDAHQIIEKVASIETFLNNVHSQIDLLDNEQKKRASELIMSIEDKFSKLGQENNHGAIQNEIRELSNQLNSFAENMKTDVINRLSDFAKNLSQQTSSSHAIVTQEVATLKDNITTLGDGIKDFKDSINHTLDNKVQDVLSSMQGLNINLGSLKSHIGEGELTLELANISHSIDNIQNGFESFKISINEVNQENANAIKEFVENALSTVPNSIDNMQNSLGELNRANLATVKEFIENALSAVPNSIDNMQNNLESFKNSLSELNGDNLATVKEFVESALLNIPNSIDNMQNNLESFKTSLNETNLENTAILKKLVENALTNIENLKIGTQLKQLAVVVEQNSSNIKDTFKELSENFAQISETTNIEVLKQLNTSIPEIADKLEIFKTVIASENEKNITQLKEQLNEAISDAKISFDVTSQQLSEKIETNATNVSYELISQKSNLEKSIETIENLKNDFVEKFENIQGKFEDLSKNIAQEFKDSIAQTKDDFISQIKENQDKIETANRENTNELKESLHQIKDDFISQIKEGQEKIEALGIENTNGLKDSLHQIKDDFISQIKENQDKIETANRENIQDFKNTALQTKESLLAQIKQNRDKFETSSKENANAIKEAIDRTKEDLASQMLAGFETARVNVANSCDKVASDISAQVATSNGLVSQNVLGLKTTFIQLKEELEEQIKKGLDAHGSILSKIEEFAQNEASFDEISRIADKAAAEKIEEILGEITTLKKEIENSINTSNDKDTLNSDSLKEFLSGLEFLQSNFLDEMKDEFKIHQGVLRKLRDEEAQTFDENNLKKIIQDTIEFKMGEIKGREKANNYTLDDVESDLAKLKVLFEQEQKESFPERLEEIRNIGLENIRLGKQAEKQINTVTDWLDSTSKVIQILSDKVEKAEKLSVQEIKTRLIKSETSTSSESINENIEDFRAEINKKYQIQEMKIENIDEKITTLVQKQGDIVDMKSFIDAFHENATQTKSLLARVEGIENQISTISGSLEKIISYIEE